MSEQIGRYVVEEHGEDGVLRARDPSLDRVVSLTLLEGDASAEERARFERHARAAAAIEHPNVVRVLETGEHDGRLFVATERFDGRTIDRAKANARDVERWLVEVARALAALHDAGIVHRAVVAKNVRVSSSGIAKLGGFTAARAAVAGPDSFRTRTVTSMADTDAGDRASWGRMALELLGEESRIASTARRAVDGDFASTNELVAALAPRPRAPRARHGVFIGSLLVTVLVSAVVAAFVLIGHRSITLDASAADVSPVTLAPPEPPAPDAAPVVVEVPSAAAATPVPAQPYVKVFIPPSACFRPDQRTEMTRWYQSAAPRLAACLRHSRNGLPAVEARSDIRISFDGTQHPATVPDDLMRADRDCLRERLDATWQFVQPQCNREETYSVYVYRGCDCAGGPPRPGRPRCADCAPTAREP